MGRERNLGGLGGCLSVARSAWSLRGGTLSASKAAWRGRNWGNLVESAALSEGLATALADALRQVVHRQNVAKGLHCRADRDLIQLDQTGRLN